MLEPQRFEDYCVNGLQVPGPDEVRTVATAVSANAESFERAAAAHADLLLVHHGLFWGSGVRALDRALKRRLQLLFEADIALAAYHLPLDGHLEIGNNALIARSLGAQRIEPFASHRRATIGVLATLGAEGMPIEDLLARTGELTNREPTWLDGGPRRVERVAIVSGSGSDYLPQAASAGAGALITGELAERATANARELGVHVIGAGHHATETFGIRALGERLADRFALEHTFIEVPNPV